MKDVAVIFWMAFLRNRPYFVISSHNSSAAIRICKNVNHPPHQLSCWPPPSAIFWPTNRFWTLRRRWARRHFTTNLREWLLNNRKCIRRRQNWYFTRVCRIKDIGLLTLITSPFVRWCVCYYSVAGLTHGVWIIGALQVCMPVKASSWSRMHLHTLK